MYTCKGFNDVHVWTDTENNAAPTLNNLNIQTVGGDYGNISPGEQGKIQAYLDVYDTTPTCTKLKHLINLLTKSTGIKIMIVPIKNVQTAGTAMTTPQLSCTDQSYIALISKMLPFSPGFQDIQPGHRKCNPTTQQRTKVNLPAGFNYKEANFNHGMALWHELGHCYQYLNNSANFNTDMATFGKLDAYNITFLERNFMKDYHIKQRDYAALRYAYSGTAFSSFGRLDAARYSYASIVSAALYHSRRFLTDPNVAYDPTSKLRFMRAKSYRPPVDRVQLYDNMGQRDTNVASA